MVANVESINGLVDEFNHATLLDNVNINNNGDDELKFDFINMQHVLWHVQFSKWDHVINTLYQLLNVDSGCCMNITHAISSGTMHELCLHFCPQLKTIDDITDYFVKNKNLKIGQDIDIINDPLSMILPESICLGIVTEMLKSSLATHQMNQDGDIYNDLEW